MGVMGILTASTPEDAALLLQDAIDASGYDAKGVDYQDPKPTGNIGDFDAVRFELKIGKQIFWVTVEEGF